MANKNLMIGAGVGVVATAAIYAIGKTVKHFIDKKSDDTVEETETDGTENTEE